MPLLERLPVDAATRQWSVWSTTARVVVTDPAAADDARLIVTRQLAAVDDACSRFRPDAELAAVERSARDSPGLPVPISITLTRLVEAAVAAAEATDGDVDPTLADDLARLGYDRDWSEGWAATDPTELHAGTAAVTVVRRVRHGWRDLRLDRTGDSPTLRLPPGMRLDLGATAKAVAADDAAARAAAELGCGVLVSLGGDVAAAGPAPDGGWQVLVQDGPGQPATVVTLRTGGLATSSTISRAWRRDGEQRHHIVDPAHGRPAEPVWRTVSVVAPSCLRANAASTAAVVQGWAAPKRLRATALPARLIGADGTVVRLGGWPPEIPAPRAER